MVEPPGYVLASFAVELVEPTAGGARNPVWAVTGSGDVPFVLRRSGRMLASLEWELDLLDDLAQMGFRVPQALPASDGHRHVHGWVLMPRFVGRRPHTESDWRRVADELAAIHEATRGRVQRPGSATAADLVAGLEQAGDVDLTAMPPEIVAACRDAWAALDVAPLGVVHGDAGASNLLLDDDGVIVLDWDESRVDVATFDRGALAYPPEPTVEQCAALAWEVATSWLPEPDYARRRWMELRTRMVL